MFSKNRKKFFKRKNFKTKEKKKHKKFDKTKKEISHSKFKCYKCKKFGHITKYCRISNKINELDLDEQTIESILQILCDYDSSSSSDSEYDEEIQVNDLEYSTSSSYLDDNELYVLTKEEEEILQKN